MMLDSLRSFLGACVLLAAVGCGQSSGTDAGRAETDSSVVDTADQSADTDTDATSDQDSSSTPSDTSSTGTEGSDGTPSGDETDAGDEVDVDDQGSSTPEPEVSDPIEAGSFSAMTTDESFTTGDGTQVPVTVYMPEESGSYPAVIFGHGFMLSPDLYESYGMHLASWGYVVLMPEYPGSIFSPTTHRTLKEYSMDLLDWLETEPGSIAGKVQAGKVAMTGHSLGGKVALLVATEDARVKAVFGLDPVDAAGGGPMSSGPTPDNPSVTPELMGQITVPFVSLGETVSGEGDGGMFSSACAPTEDNFEQYYIHASGPALQIDVLGASHMSFLDDPNCGITCSVCAEGTDDPAVSRALTQRYMTAFFEFILKENRGYITYLTGAGIAADVADGFVTFATKNGFGN